MTTFSSLDTEEKQRLLTALWLLFLEKIDAEWEDKYAVYGPNREEIKATTKLAKAIQLDMEKVLRKSQLLNYLTIHKYLSEGGWSTHVKSATIDQFLHYLNFESWQDFKNQQLSEGENPNQPEVRKNTRMQWQWIGPVIISIILC
ncbi:MAG: hypothetical protein AAFU67_10125 [Bacteroidota bacterium]